MIIRKYTALGKLLDDDLNLTMLLLRTDWGQTSLLATRCLNGNKDTLKKAARGWITNGKKTQGGSRKAPTKKEQFESLARCANCKVKLKPTNIW
jgi:hypothetical protein